MIAIGIIAVLTAMYVLVFPSKAFEEDKSYPVEFESIRYCIEENCRMQPR